MDEHKLNSQGTPAPGEVVAPEGSREEGVSDGANSNFGPTLDSVPTAGGTEKPEESDQNR